MKKLPKYLYVNRSNAGTEDEFFNAGEELTDVDDGPVGIYELKETRTKKTKTILE